MKNVKKLFALTLAVIVAFSCCISGASANETFVKTEAEDNGTVDTANLIEMDIMEGVLDSEDDVDCFKFTIDKAGIFMLTFDHDYVAADTDYFFVELFGLVSDGNGGKKEAKFYSFYSAGNQSDERDPNGALKGVGKEVAPKCSLAALETGEFYYIRVSKGIVIDNSVDYKIAYTVDESSYCEKEPNNDPLTATTIIPIFDNLSGTVTIPPSSSSRYVGMLGPNDDASADSVDYYRVTVSTKCYMYFAIGHETSTTKENAAYKVDVIAYSDDENGVFSNPSVIGGVTLPKDTSYTESPSVGLDAHTYYIRVTNTTPVYGVYQLFAYYRLGDTETEPNNTQLQADVVSAQGKIYGSTLDSSDIDWYTVSVTNAENFTLNFNSIKKTNLDAGWTIEVFEHGTATKIDGVGVVKANADGTVVKIDLPKGTAAQYDIKVSGAVNRTTDTDYQIEFTSVVGSGNASFLELLKGSFDPTNLITAFKFIMNFNWGNILPSLVKQVSSVINLLVGMFG